jgi:hypothetical protein
MKQILVVAIIIVSAIVVNGQGQSQKSDSYKNHLQDIKKPELQPIPSITIGAVNQQTTDDQKNGTKNKTQNYFKLLFSPANLPNIALALVAIIGIIVAICTLKTIGQQTKATEIAARATKESADVSRESLVLLNRPWLDTDNWTAEDFNKSWGSKPVIRIAFHIVNLSPTPARIEQIEISHVIFRGIKEMQTLTGHPPIREIRDVKTMVTPKSYYPVYLIPGVFGPYHAEGMFIQVSGCITYKDAFRKIHRKRFSRLGHIRDDKQEFMIPAGTDSEGVGWNDEEDWDQDYKNPI